jgi:hypothetical protein
MQAFSDLNGLRVAIKIGVEKGTGGHADKNKVAEYLTPNPASQSGHKHYQRLVAGQFAPDGAKPATPAAQGGFGGFGGTGQPAAQTAATGGFGAPAQGGGAAPASGFSQAPATGQSGSGNAGFAAAPATTASATTSPSDPAATPQWLAQAGAGASNG